MEKETAAGGSIKHPRCPYCHEGVAPDQGKQACDACMAWHHSECWAEHGGCSACGSEARVGEAAPKTRPPRPRPRPAGDGLIASEIENAALRQAVEVEEARRELGNLKYNLLSTFASVAVAVVVSVLSLSFAANQPGLAPKIFGLVGVIIALALLSIAFRGLRALLRVIKRARD